jgi:hypothetical protein
MPGILCASDYFVICGQGNGNLGLIQRFAADKKVSYPTYELAKAAAMKLGDDMDSPRRRIRRRAGGTFDLITYKELPKKTEE